MLRSWMIVVFALLASASFASGDEKLPLRVLYLGNNSERSEDFEQFLKSRFEFVESRTHSEFDKPSLKKNAIDVVLLDWSQDEAYDFDDPKARFEVKSGSPIGDRDEWTTPTVLLGSAGHLLAGFWEVVGGSG